MQIISGVWGFVILVVGRQYYATFVGGVFFFASTIVIDQFWGTPEGIQAIWIPLIFAALGWFLSLELRRLVARPAIFAAGYFVFDHLLPVLGVEVPLHWAFLVLGGAVFFVTSLLFFDYTLIVLSMLTGATLILESAGLERGMNQALFILMAIFSFGAQVVLRRYSQPVPD
jgi:hypothetical protein